jgi:hypothetical protein
LVTAANTGIDLIADFQLSQDFILLADGLTFSDLEIIQQDTAVAIAVADQPTSAFAILNNISAEMLTEANFITEELI